MSNPQPWIDEGEIMEMLAHLIEKSLIIREEDEKGQVRYRLLETVRQYGLDRLMEREENAAVRNQHRDYYLALAEDIEPEIGGAKQAGALDWFHAESDNLRAALEWSQSVGQDVERELRLALAQFRFWDTRGHLYEARKRIEDALARSAADTPTPERARALHFAASLAWRQGDYPAARVFGEESLELWKRLGEKQGLSGALNVLANIAYYQGDHEAAGELYEASLQTARELGDTRRMAVALNNLGLVATYEGDYALAKARYEEALSLRREQGDRRGIANILNNLSELAVCQQDFAGARTLQTEVLAIQEEVGDRLGRAYSLYIQADIYQAEGRYDAAREALRESLTIRHVVGEKWGVAILLQAYGALSTRIGQPERAARLFGAAQSLRATIGSPILPREREEFDRQIAALRVTLGEETFATAWVTGSALLLEEAIAYALSNEDTP